MGSGGNDLMSDDSVIVQTHQDTFKEIYSLINEKQAQLKSITNSNNNSSIAVAHSGTLGSKCFDLKEKIQEKLSPTSKTTLSLTFADQLVEKNEDIAALQFYESASKAASSTNASPELIKALYGVGLCNFRIATNQDPNLRYPETLGVIESALKSIQKGMKVALTIARDQKSNVSHYVLNGTIHIYKIATLLQTLGFAQNILCFLQYCVMSLEALVNLSTTTYLPWRLRIYGTIAQCYNQLSNNEAAVKAINRATSQLQTLRQEEEMDPPIPASMARMFTEEEEKLKILKLKYQQTSNCLSELQTEFPNPSKRFCVILELLSKGAVKRENDREIVSHVYSMMQEYMACVKPSGVENSPSVLNEIYENIVKEFDVRHLVVWLEALYSRGAAFSSDYYFEEFEEFISVLINYNEKDRDDELHSRISVLSRLRKLEQSVKDCDDNDNPDKVVLKSSSSQCFSVACVKKLSKELMKLSSIMDLVTINSDLLASYVYTIWNDFGLHLISEIDNADSDENIKKKKVVALNLLLPLYRIALSIDFDDIILQSVLGLRLALLYSQLSQKRYAIQILRRALDSVRKTRTEWTLQVLHASLVSDDSQDAFSAASFSADYDNLMVDSTKGRSTAIGVKGTGSQLGSSMYQELCVIQTDLEETLFRTEFIRINEEMQLEMANKTTTSNNSTKLARRTASIEARLGAECKKNNYSKALLLLQQALVHDTGSDTQTYCLQDAAQCLKAAEAEEKALVDQLQYSKSDSNSNSNVPPAPVIVSRSSSHVTLRIQALSNKNIKYYSVYGKPAGAGTSVSLNNCSYSGTGVPVFPTPEVPATVTVSGLCPNDSYVFAVAAFDNEHRVINGIGATTPLAVVTCSPLPKLVCWAYLVKVASQVGNNKLASEGFEVLYNHFVSRVAEGRSIWKANPYYSHAITYNLLARSSIPLLELFVTTALLVTKNQSRHTIVSCPGTGKLSTPVELTAILNSKRISVALEVAIETGNDRLITTAAHRLYQSIVPILNLSYRGYYPLHALLLISQALQISKSAWDDATSRVYACTCYEILRLGKELGESKVISNSIAQISNDARGTTEVESLSEVALRINSDTTIKTNSCELVKKMSINLREAKDWVNEQKEDFLELSCKLFRHVLETTGDDDDDSSLVEFKEWMADHKTPQEFLKNQRLNALVKEHPTLFGTELAAIEEFSEEDENTEEDFTSESEMNVVRWWGEKYFLQAIVDYKGLKSEKLCNTDDSPDRDLSLDLEAGTEITNTNNITEPSQEFNSLLQNAARACRLFQYASTPLNLQSVVQVVWNAIWTAWVSPTHFGKDEYQPLLECTLCIIEMVELGMSRDDDDDNINWYCDFVNYTMQVLCVMSEWQVLVEVGERMHLAITDKSSSTKVHSESFFPLMIYAQNQIRNAQSALFRDKKLEIESFVKVFNDIQAKQKSKKKARLMLNSGVVSAEEQLFNQQRQEKEEALLELKLEEASKRDHLLRIESMLDEIQRSKYSCLESVEKSQSVCQLFLRKSSGITTEKVVKAYRSSILLCRQKRDTLLTSQALQELGDFYYSVGQIEEAGKTWNDGVDAVFGTLDAATMWNTSLKVAVPNPTERFGLDATLICVSLLGKLSRLTTANAIFRRYQYVEFAASLIESVFTCSVGHPARLCDFATYVPADIWPNVDILSQRLMLQPVSLLHSLYTIATNLYSKSPLLSLPSVTLLEYVALHRFQSLQMVLEAKLLRISACTKAGFIAEAFSVVTNIIEFQGLPSDKLLALPFQVQARSLELQFCNGKSVESNASFISTFLSTKLLNDTHVTAYGNEFCQKLWVKILELLIASNNGESCKSFIKTKSQELYEEVEGDNYSQVTLKSQCCLIQARVSFLNGEWKSTVENATASMKVLEQMSSGNDDTVMIDGRNDSASAIWICNRLLLVKCALFQNQLEVAQDQIDFGVQEAESVSDTLSRRCLMLLQLQIYVAQGRPEDAKDVATYLIKQSREAKLRDSTYVQALRAQSDLSNDSLLLVEAMEITKENLQECGWIGTSSDASTFEEIGNRYNHPWLQTLLEVKLEVAKQQTEIRMALAHVNDALDILPLTNDVSPSLYPSLLALQGKLYYLLSTASGDNNLLENATESLKLSLDACISTGGHDHTLMASVCMTLVQAALNDDEATTFYLSLTTEILEKKHLLWNDKTLSESISDSTELPPAFVSRLNQITAASVQSTYVALLRERAVYPSDNRFVRDLAISVHYVLSKELLSYRNNCCVLSVEREKETKVTSRFVAQWVEESSSDDIDDPPNTLYYSANGVAGKVRVTGGSMVRALHAEVCALRISMSDEICTESPEVRNERLEAVLSRLELVLTHCSSTTGSSAERQSFDATVENVTLLEQFLDTDRGLDTTNESLCSLLYGVVKR